MKSISVPRIELSPRGFRVVTWVLMATPLGVSFDFFSRAEASADYYAVVAQVIAAMYLAVALESFTSGGVRLDLIDRVEFGVLLAVSWFGLVACVRGLAIAEPESWTAGLGGMGMIASALLVTTNLANRVSLKNPRLVTPVVIISCFVPLIVLLPRAG